MKNKILGYVELTEKAFVEAPFNFGLIFILALTQLLFSYIPQCLIINFSLVFFIIFLESSFFTKLNKKNKLIFYISIPIFLITLYLIRLFTHSEYLLAILTATFIFLNYISLILYISTKENYLIEFISRIRHLMISLIFFLIPYVLIYLIAFFVDNIFNLQLTYYKSTLYRVANSISSVIACVVFIVFKREQEYGTTKLFEILFKKVLPSLLLPVLSLAIIYFFKLIINIDDNTEDFITGFYYTFAFLFFLILPMMHLCEKNRITRVIVLLSSIVPLLFIIILVKYNLIQDKTQYHIGLNFNDEKILINYIHEILINILISAYCIYLFVKNKKVDFSLSIFTLIITTILFFPAIGYFNFSEYHTRESFNKKLEQTKYEEFKIEYKRWCERYENRFERNKPEDKEQRFTAYFNSIYRNSPKAKYLIDSKNFSKIALGIYLSKNQNNSTKYKDSISINNYTFSLNDDNKKLIVKTAEGNIFEYDIYNKAKPNPNKKNEDKHLNFENEEFLISIIHYNYNKHNEYYTIEFDVYFKK